MRVLTTILSLALIAVVALTAPTAAQTGQLSLPSDHQYERYDPNAASYGKIDASQVPSLIQQKAWIYDRTAKDWVYRPSQGLNPMYSAGASARAKEQGGWHRVHGHVQSISGTSMSFRSDDGQTMSIDMSAVSPGIRQALSRGEAVTVIGHRAGDANHLRAEYIQQDSSDPTRHGRTTGSAPSASPGRIADEKNWQRVHGEITSVESGQFTLRADDGRTVYVSTGEVSPPSARSGLQPGQRVTVLGSYNADQSQMTARRLERR
jgi:outer membrane lipoprotein SlyB